MRKTLINSLIIIIIIALSIGCGFLYDHIADTYQRNKYPRGYNDTVSALSLEYRVPTWAIYTTIKMRSDFDPSLKTEDGGIGLFSLTAEQYAEIGEELDLAVDAGLLYEPETNLRFGTYWLSSLYIKYGNWDCVWAAIHIGEPTVDEWRWNANYSNADGTLKNIPDEETAEYIENANEIAEIYRKLYD